MLASPARGRSASIWALFGPVRSTVLMSHGSPFWGFELGSPTVTSPPILELNNSPMFGDRTARCTLARKKRLSIGRNSRPTFHDVLVVVTSWSEMRAPAVKSSNWSPSDRARSGTEQLAPKLSG